MTKQAKIVVTGLVQGVNFRYDTKKKAEELNLKGQVRNLDSSNQVEIIAEGDIDDIYKIILWCKTRDDLVKIEDVDVKWLKTKEKFEGFEIIYE